MGLLAKLSSLARSGLGLDAVTVTFMAIRGGALDPTNKYQSKQAGGPGGGRKPDLGLKGEPVVGIFGGCRRTNAILQRLGLVYVSPRGRVRWRGLG